jgi:hypothetical protein
MKANEAPEKIILSADRDTKELYTEWVTRDLTDNIKIEYTRTDAFIEKACEYLHEHLIDYWSQSVTNESKFIDEFIKYMKGELE